MHLLKDWSASISEKWANQLLAFRQQFDQLQHLEHMQNTLGTFLQNPNTASNLAKDQPLEQAVENAKAYISGALAAMLNLGKGSGPLNHAFSLKYPE